jgi:hypothetical protein
MSTVFLVLSTIYYSLSTIHCLYAITANNESLKDNKATRAGALEAVLDFAQKRYHNSFWASFCSSGFASARIFFFTTRE